MEVDLKQYEDVVEAALEELSGDHVISRIWDRDHTVWKPDPDEIADRLGWLDIGDRMKSMLPELKLFAAEMREAGFEHVLLLGMGGSSLAPEVVSRVFGGETGALELEVLDTTDPDAIRQREEQLELDRTLFVVSTKSGGTVETLSLFKHFYNRILARKGDRTATGEQFVAITDPGSRLVELAEKWEFRRTFLNDPEIGGRYSALSYFGLVPAILVGVDLERLLGEAGRMVENSRVTIGLVEGRNESARLGSILGELARRGRDKLTLFTSSGLAGFEDWVEQLVAESSGKEGKGVLPVVTEPIGAPAAYGDDRLFVFLILEGDTKLQDHADGFREAGHPVVKFTLADPYELGGQFFLWEMATAILGERLGIQPFDQPNVESAKSRARDMLKAYRREGELPSPEPDLVEKDVRVYGSEGGKSVRVTLGGFLESLQPGDYVSLQAYVEPTDGIGRRLQELSEAIRNRTGVATTFGFGPRFLHSTGQLHKGDRGNGRFLQIVTEPQEDLPIPEEVGSGDSSMPFGVLKIAQALGDRSALREAGRKVIQYRCAAKSVESLLDRWLDAFDLDS